MKETRRNFIKANQLTLVSCGISLAIFTIFALIIAIPASILNPSNTQNKPFVSFHNLNETNQDSNLILKEQSLVFDSEPIFIPTQWNELPNPFKNIVNHSLFGEFPPITRLYDRTKIATVMHEDPSVSAPIDILNSKFINPFIGINENNLAIVPLKKHSAYVTIQNLQDLKIVEEYEIVDDSDEQIREQLWAPIELLLIVDESGPIMPLFMTESSGIEQIDNFFKNHISKPVLKLGSLPIGYYKISVSP